MSRLKRLRLLLRDTRDNPRRRHEHRGNAGTEITPRKLFSLFSATFVNTFFPRSRETFRERAIFHVKSPGAGLNYPADNEIHQYFPTISDRYLLRLVRISGHCERPIMVPSIQGRRPEPTPGFPDVKILGSPPVASRCVNFLILRVTRCNNRCFVEK